MGSNVQRREYFVSLALASIMVGPTTALVIPDGVSSVVKKGGA